MAIEIPEEDLIYKEDCSLWLLCMDIIKCMRQDKEFMDSLKKRGNASAVEKQALPKQDD